MSSVNARFGLGSQGFRYAQSWWNYRYVGLTEAINLDGGGSTTLWTEKTGVINHPYDNKKFDHVGERTVPNLIVVY